MAQPDRVDDALARTHSTLSYRLDQTAKRYSESERIHDDIPASYRYWNTKYVAPAMRSMIEGETPQDMFVLKLTVQFLAKPGRRLQFVSVGAG